jgi:cytochrome c-type biogenesis protein CcmE
MRHRNRRLATIAVSAVVLIAAVGLGLFALRSAVVFFYTPTEIAAEQPEIGERIRVGGLVLEGSVVADPEGGVSFSITDRAEVVSVRYDEILPDLFREGQGVIAEGAFQDGDVFVAQTVLAKHDETYMPPEVADALRDAGVWQGETDGDSETGAEADTGR